MRAFLLAGLLAAALAPLAAAQPGGGSIAGVVLDDATGAPVETATITLYRDSSFVTGTVTGPDGSFLIDRLRPGAYLVRVSFIGFASQTFPAQVGMGTTAEIGTVRLAEDAAQLGEVEVGAQRAFVEQQADRTAYNVAEQAITAGGNALEVLETLPSLEVDLEGNVSLRGSQNVAIQINGRPIPVSGNFLAALLRQIPAQNIERIEVIPNPSARYEPDGMSGIVNIVLKDGTNRGLAGGVTVGGGTAPSGEASANLSYQAGSIDAYASYGYRYSSRDAEGATFRENLNGSPFAFLDQTEVSDNSSSSHLLNTQFDYTLSDRTVVGLRGLASYRDGTSGTAVGSFFLDPIQNPTDGFNRLTDGFGDGLNVDIALRLEQSLGQQQAQGTGAAGRPGTQSGGRPQFGPQRLGSGSGPGENGIVAELRYSANTDDDEDLFTQQPLDGSGNPNGAAVEELNRTDQLNREGYLQVDYARPLALGRLEAGYKGTLRSLDNDFIVADLVNGQEIVDPAQSNSFVFDENVQALYVQTSQSLGPLSAQLGLRAELARTDFTLGTTSETFENNYESLFPSAFLAYSPSPGTVGRLSYSRRINRPRSFQLNPFSTQNDPFNIRAGNPALRPEYVEAFELTLQYKYFLTVTPFYRHTTDVIRRRVVVDPATGVSTFTFQNLDSNDSYGTDVTLAAAFGPVRGFVSGSAYRTVTNGESVESNLASDAFAWTVRGSATLAVREGTQFQAFAFYRAPLEVEDGRISSFLITSLGVRQNLFDDRASVSLRVSDLLDTIRFRFNTGNEIYIQTGLRDPAAQQVQLTFSYTFGDGGNRRTNTQQPDQQDGGDGFGF